jgi:hypothetical protein
MPRRGSVREATPEVIARRGDATPPRQTRGPAMGADAPPPDTNTQVAQAVAAGSAHGAAGLDPRVEAMLARMDAFLTQQRQHDGDEAARQRHRREQEEDRRRYGDEPRWRLDRDDEFASMARLVGDAVRGEDRPTMLLAPGLSVITHVEAPWRALSPPHLLRPAAGAAERFATQFVATRLHFQVTITTTTSGTATVEALLTELRMAEQLLVGILRQLEMLGVPMTKDAWFPVMCAAARILGIFATMRFGYLLGGAKVNKAWEEGWRKGLVDVEALWPTQKAATEVTAAKPASRGGREAPKGPQHSFRGR